MHQLSVAARQVELVRDRVEVEAPGWLGRPRGSGGRRRRREDLGIRSERVRPSRRALVSMIAALSRGCRPVRDERLQPVGASGPRTRARGPGCRRRTRSCAARAVSEPRPACARAARLARAGGDVLHVGDGLLPPVLEDLEVLRTQVDDALALLVRDHRVDLDHVRGDPDHGAGDAQRASPTAADWARPPARPSPGRPSPRRRASTSSGSGSASTLGLGVARRRRPGRRADWPSGRASVSPPCRDAARTRDAVVGVDDGGSPDTGAERAARSSSIGAVRRLRASRRDRLKAGNGRRPPRAPSRRRSPSMRRSTARRDNCGIEKGDQPILEVRALHGGEHGLVLPRPRPRSRAACSRWSA